MKSEIILPRIEISRTLPSNYSAPKAYLGKTQEVKLIDYGKAYVNLDNLIFRGLRLMKESRPDFSKSFYCLQKILVHLYFKSKIIDMKDVPVLVIADGASPYLYHWLCDNLVRAHLAKKHYKNDFKVVLPKNFYEADFCLKSLEMIGISKDQVIKIDRREAVTSNHIIFPTHILGGSLSITAYDPAIIEVGNTMLDYCKKNSALNFSLGERIFLSRSKQKKRILLNQKEADELLLRYGFALVNSEDLSFEEKISMSYHAKHMIGQSGSGLTLAMFMQKGGKMLEFYPTKEYGDVNGGTWYREICQAFGLEHFYQYCEVDQSNIYVNEFHTDMTVDLTELEANIKKMLNQ